MIRTLPDMDGLVLAAIRDQLPDVNARRRVPDNWLTLLPMVVAHRVPGSSSADSRGVDVAVMDVQCLAADARASSALARDVRAALLRAARDRYRGTDGYISRVTDISTPSEIPAGSLATGPDLVRYSATYRVTARPLP